MSCPSTKQFARDLFFGKTLLSEVTNDYEEEDFPTAKHDDAV